MAIIDIFASSTIAIITDPWFQTCAFPFTCSSKADEEKVHKIRKGRKKGNGKISPAVDAQK